VRPIEVLVTTATTSSCLVLPDCREAVAARPGLASGRRVGGDKRPRIVDGAAVGEIGRGGSYRRADPEPEYRQASQPARARLKGDGDQKER
jgi:hypothetical protein